MHLPMMDHGRLALVDLETDTVSITDIIWGGDWCVWEGQSTLRINGERGLSQLAIDVTDLTRPTLLNRSSIPESDIFKDVIASRPLIEREEHGELKWYLGEIPLDANIDGKTISLHGSYAQIGDAQFVWLDREGQIWLLDISSSEQSVIGTTLRRSILFPCDGELMVFADGIMRTVTLP